MKSKFVKITIKDLIKGFVDNDDEGVFGYGGKLNIRPAYQREFIYKDKQMDAVIDTILNKMPLGLFYWVKNKDGSYEILDGQQRTMSICKFRMKPMSFRGVSFSELTDEEKEDFDNYKIYVEICEGDERETLDWFERINTIGEALTDQEMLNAVFTGAWLTDAKKRFSKRQCPAQRIGIDYLTGDPIRQKYLETVLKWISSGEIREYMKAHRYDKDAKELWDYYEAVIEWIEATFPVDNRLIDIKPMEGVDWGRLYNDYQNEEMPDDIDKILISLLNDDEITAKKGIYEYLLTDEEKHLNLRQFSKDQIRKAFTEQGGKCNLCKKTLDLKAKKGDDEQVHGDHIRAWSNGGETEQENCQALCRDCNLMKSNY